ncbi:hypothetical protein C7N43_23065 [Sphingobacteriales bacterium UPWRP_1]|nr:hypothetical protein B6N25_05855 [Sphingobacteriales bacterium TSM_CSS]PSJ74630.1 hypothetical protein C7N43_23065 [Sphingobacteriales bacterium UPWRP_1]
MLYQTLLRMLCLPATLCLFLFSILSAVKVQAQELPPPASNVQNIESGAYLIPLDQSKQQATITDAVNGLTFSGINLAAYGLVHLLLQNGIPVKWAIKASKPKDGIDFTATVARLYPSAQAPATADFVGSVFVIDMADINQLVCNPVNTPAFPDIDSLITAFGNDVAVYTLNTATPIDVRYTLRFAPEIAVLNNGGNTAAFTQIFNAAHIPYSEIGNADLQTATDCYTFILQPNATGAATVTTTYVAAVNNFINSGGNFWAQSGMALALENQGLFMTTAGILGINTAITPPFNYVASAMPVLQFEGNFPAGLTGDMGTFGLAAGSSWRPATYPCLLLNLPVGANQFVCYAADVNGAIAGGNLYYCGANEFSLTAIAPTPANAAEILQTQRMVLNAAFVPAAINYACAGNDICICRGESVKLGCTEGGFAVGEVSWTPALGLSCTDCPNPIANPLVTTTYTVTPVNGSCNAFASVTVTVIQDKPQVSNLDIDCNTDKTAYTVSFTMTGGDAATYQVSGNTGTFNGNVFTSDPIPTGTTYTFSAGDSYHCDTLVTGSFNCVLCQPAAILTGGGSACLDGNVSALDLQVSFAGQAPWELYYAIDGEPQLPVSSEIPDFTLSATQSGQYTLVSVEDAHCFGSVTGTASVSAIPVPVVNLGSDTTLCLGEVITLNANLPETDLLWQDGSTQNTYATAVSGTYWVQLSNECGLAADTVVVTFEDCSAPRCRPLLPDAFSPNADGVNDLFTVVFNCEVSYFRLLVFDRWGQQVYESSNPHESWAGLQNDRSLPLGLYVWKLEYQFAEDAEDPHRIAKGNILLLR